MIDIIVPENVKTREERILDQRTGFAVKACHMMGKTIEETCSLLAMNYPDVELFYDLIDADIADFDSGIDD